MRRPAALLLALATIPALLTGVLATAAPASAADCGGSPAPFTAGDGSSGTPYEVATAAQLNSIRDAYLACHFEQTADISLEAYSPWTALGSTEDGSTSFTGSYDGQGHAITDMTAQAVAGGAAGLFNDFSGATVSNLRISGSASGGYVVGGLAGRADATTVVTNVHVNAVITATGGQAGVLIGDSQGTIRRSSTSGSVSAFNLAGGIVGNAAFGGTYEDVMSSATVTATYYAGGIIGEQFVCCGTSASYTHALAIGPVSATHSPGGLVGRLSNPGGSGSVTATDAYWDPVATGQLTSRSGTSKTTAELKDINTFSGWNMATSWTAGETGWAICARANSGYPFLQGAYASDPCTKPAQDPLTVVATSPAEVGTTQTLSTTGGSGEGAVTYSVGDSDGCSVDGSTLSIDGQGDCAVTATKAEDADYRAQTSDPLDITITVQVPGAPRDVTVTAGNATIKVQWLAPSATGTYPVTDYEVSASPGDAVCSTEGALTCDLTNLANGTEYTVTVRAKSLAGWSAASASATATPVAPPDITVTATVVGGSARVEGQVVGIPAGSVLVPEVRVNSKPWRADAPLIFVRSDGSFSWRRTLGATERLSLRITYGEVTSNTLAFSNRRLL